ncbi:hypothetical protein NQZ68_033448 [Dissostichus eleginoides]|uniref:Vacuolar protein sorting-associated protein 13a n=1 Tax=Dissostichus eleginoides TaxID=100907 RepID=A0AAD9CBQ5_DISEL|nr:hypothetical protein NQZ68_033448 [Dissostichus eleginoides]KAK1899425.1 Vacuolar protein sorting-associated protein 13a [Dissostichus eleginoides]
MSSGKAINQSKAKHCGAANEVAMLGRSPSCHSLLLKKTVKANLEMHAFHCPRSNSSERMYCSPSSPNHKHRACWTSRSLQKWAFDHGRNLKDVFKKDSKRNYVGSMRLTPEKSFALMALRGLASTHWASTEDEHRRLAKTNSLCHDERTPGPSQDIETKPTSSSKNIQSPQHLSKLRRM